MKLGLYSEMEKFSSNDAGWLIWITSELQQYEAETTSGLFNPCPYV